MNKAACMLAILLGLGQSLAAQTRYIWTGVARDGDWNNVANWDTYGVPLDQDAALAGLNGDMDIIFDADGPTNNVPLLKSSNGAGDGTTDMPRIHVSQGGVSLTVNREAFWKKSPTWSHPNFHMLQVGDGVNSATLNLDGDTSTIELARFDKDNIPFTATVENNATLNFPDDVALTDGTAVDMQITVKGGGTLTTGTLSVDPADLGSGDSYIAIETGGQYTFKSGTGLSTLAEVESYVGTVFRGLDGGLLDVTQNGDEFTITSLALPHPASNPLPADGSASRPVDVHLTWNNSANTLSYDVYFGTTGNMVFQTNQLATSFDPGALTDFTTYEWRIDTVNTSGVTTGTQWSFTTSDNHSPVFGSDAFSAPDAAQNAHYSENLLVGSATDVDGDALTYSLVDGPGWLHISPDGTAWGTPRSLDHGLQTWTVQVDDGLGGTDTATLTLTVPNTYDPGPLTYEELFDGFRWAWHNADLLFDDDPDNILRHKLREMRTYGYSGIHMNFRTISVADPYLNEEGKWVTPQPYLDALKRTVDFATEVGYYVIVEPNTFRFANLRDGSFGYDTHEERLTRNYVQRANDTFEQVVELLKDYRNVVYRTNNEFHGYKYEQTLDPSHPDYLTAAQAHDEFINEYMIPRGIAARTIKPDGWVFYRNEGQLIRDMHQLPYPLGIDPEPTASPSFTGIAHNFNTADEWWGYWGLNHPTYTHDYLKHLRMNRKAPPTLESAGLLAEFMKTNNMGGIAYRFGSFYHFFGPKYGDRLMTDYQCIAQVECMLDFFNDNRSMAVQADGATSGGVQNLSIYIDKERRARAYNYPHLDMLFDTLTEKSASRRLELKMTPGGQVSHNMAPEHRGMHMVRIGDELMLTAVPDAGYEFTGWQGSVTNMDNSLEVIVPDAHGVIWATFAPTGQEAPEVDLTTKKRHWDAFESIEAGYVDFNQPDANFGNNTTNLLLRPYKEGEPALNALEKRPFLKFDVDQVPDPSTIAYATVKIYNTYTTNFEPIFEIFETDNGWDRDTLTWNNMPAIAESDPISRYDSTDFIHARSHLEVTDYFKSDGNGPGIHSFVIRSDQLYSRDTEVTIPNSVLPYSMKTDEKPLLYIVWDEVIPIVPWGQTVPAERVNALSPAIAEILDATNTTVDLTWSASDEVEFVNVYFGTNQTPPLVSHQRDAIYDDFDSFYTADNLQPGTTYFWRVDTVTSKGAVTEGELRYFTVDTDTTLPPSQPTDPQPVDGAVDQLAELELTWLNGGGATSYDVYFGTTGNMTLQGNQPGISFDPGTLTYAAGYDWRIDAVNAFGTTTGAVWSFTADPGLNDSDGDGMIDLHEQLAGTDPNNPASVLKMQIDSSALPSPLIRWSSVSNRQYRVLKGTNLIAGVWGEVTNGIMANPPENQLPIPTDNEQAFFRIELDE